MPADNASPAAAASERLRLRAGRAELELSRRGGCITAFRWHREDGAVDWMRPAPAGDDFAPTDAACFPLVPYSNRIRDGRFVFEGEPYQLALNFPPESHSIHGHGWQGEWELAAGDGASATLIFDFPAAGGEDPWPAAYRAEQRFLLGEDSLTVEIAVTNCGSRNMPVSLGLHPYFLRSADCRLIAEVGQMWQSDATMLPTDLVAPEADKDPGQGIRPADVSLDSVFTGFAGRAEIAWPGWGAKLTMQSDQDLGFLVVFTPAGEDFFCVEPVSAMTDAVNQASQGRRDSGLRILGPGERFAAKTVFTPQLD